MDGAASGNRGDSAVSLVMKVSPDGTPYIAYKMERETSADEALGVLALKDGTWSSLGKVSEGRVGSYMDMAFNAAGMPTVSYVDYTNKISQQASVKVLNGSTWSFVGGATATTNKVSYHTINYLNDNKLMLLATYDAKDNVLARRELSVNTFENGTWTNNTTIPGRASDLVAYLQVSETLGDVLYLGVYNAVSPNSISVYKYANNNWTTLLDKWSDEKATAISLRDFDIAVNQQGDVYVAFPTTATTGRKSRVIKVDAETKQVTPVGTRSAPPRDRRSNLTWPFPPRWAYRTSSIGTKPISPPRWCPSIRIHRIGLLLLYWKRTKQMICTSGLLPMARLTWYLQRAVRCLAINMMHPDNKAAVP